MSQNLPTNLVHTEQAQSQPAQPEGRTVVIFGGTSGIGLSPAIQAGAAGARLSSSTSTGTALSRQPPRTAPMAGAGRAARPSTKHLPTSRAPTTSQCMVADDGEIVAGNG